MWPAIIVLVFAIALAVRPRHGDGWFWEVGNGLGFLAFALVIVLTFNGRGGSGHSLHHRWLGIAVFVAVFVHALWFLLGDPITWEYLKWGAPHYMVAGLFSAGLVLLITVTSLVSLRNASYSAYKPFRRWHHGLSIAVLAGALVHVLLSGFYIAHLWQAVVLIAITLGAYFLPTRYNIDASFSTRNVILVSLAVGAIYGFVRIGTHL